jgi:hypothetical protein
MSFLSRLLRRGPAPGGDVPDGEDAPAIAHADPPGPEASHEVAPAAPPVPEAIACPSCARLVDPPPVRTRKCPHCRRPIIVRRTDGRTVYLTEAAVEVFKAERQREADMAAWTTQRAQWLRLAKGVGASQERRGRIAARPVSAESVADARALYLASAAKERKEAARLGAWDIAARIGREEAMALYREAGSPIPVPDEIAEIHTNAMSGLLRSLKGTGTHAEIVGGSCCAACRADDGRAFAIADELRHPRLPHAGCPRGLCPCEWWIGVTPPKKRRSRRSA